LASARALRASSTLKIAGSNSGLSPTASAMENSSASAIGRAKRTLIAKTTTTSTVIAPVSNMPNWRTPRSNSVSGGRSRSFPAIAP
jgi:hypothetical protein